MKNIAFLTTDLSDYGGTQTVVSRLSNAFSDKLGYNIFIYTLSQKNGDIKFALNQNVVHINMNIDFTFKNYYRLIREINRLNLVNRIDAILGIGCYLSVFLPFFKNVRKIACEHNSYDIVSNVTRIVRYISYKYVDFIVSSTNEDLPKYISINKNSITIHNPIIVTLNYSEQEKKNIVVSAGSLNERKGFDRLLKVWKLVEKNNKDIKLEIYGEGDEKEKLLLQKEELGLINVYFMGNTQYLSEIFNRSKLFVLTSRKEGFPMVLLDAMNQSLPIVSFDIKTGPKEIVTDSEDGYLINDGDIEEMASKILELLSDNALWENMSHNAKKNIERFSIDNIIKKWENIL